MSEATYPPSPEVYLRGQHDQKMTEVMQMIAVASQRDVTIANLTAENEVLKAENAELKARLEPQQAAGLVPLDPSGLSQTLSNGHDAHPE